MGYKNSDPCLQKAFDDEQLFVLMTRDRTSPQVVLEWIKLNIETQPDEKLREAFECALQMQNEQRHFVERKRHCGALEHKTECVYPNCTCEIPMQKLATEKISSKPPLADRYLLKIKEVCLAARHPLDHEAAMKAILALIKEYYGEKRMFLPNCSNSSCKYEVDGECECSREFTRSLHHG